jgi:hypothetical protein
MTTPAGKAQTRAPLVRHALAELKLPGDAERSQIAEHMLTQLAGTSFLPDGEAHELYLAALGDPSMAKCDLLQVSVALEERVFRTLVDRFAQRFFAIELEKRTRQWQWFLLHTAAYPEIVARLRRWEPGLAVTYDAAAYPDERTAKLARWLADWFLMPHAQAAWARQDAWLEVRREPQLWAEAAAWLRQNRTELAALDHTWLDRVVHWSNEGDYSRVRTFFNRKDTIAREKKGYSAKSIGIWVAAVMLISVVSSLLRGTSSNKRPHPERPSTSSQFGLPQSLPESPPEDLAIPRGKALRRGVDLWEHPERQRRKSPAEEFIRNGIR